MRLMIRRGRLAIVLVLTAAFAVLGCNQADNKGASDQARAKSKGADKTANVDNGHGWWCEEHGIPEEICGKCNKEYRDKQKAAGDWCETHKRLQSQCFQCDPSLYEKVFEPMYVAKYGKKPERPPEKEFQK
jgi:hypothetical protein